LHEFTRLTKFHFHEFSWRVGTTNETVRNTVSDVTRKLTLGKLSNGPCTNKKLSYRRGTARCVVSVEILPSDTQQCRNYLYNNNNNNLYKYTCTSPEQIEVMKLAGYSGPPFDRVNATSYSTLIETMRLPCTVFEI